MEMEENVAAAAMKSESAARRGRWNAEIPAFVTEIKTIFEPWQLADYLEAARQTEPFDPFDPLD